MSLIRLSWKKKLTLQIKWKIINNAIIKLWSHTRFNIEVQKRKDIRKYILIYIIPLSIARLEKRAVNDVTTPPAILRTNLKGYNAC